MDISTLRSFFMGTSSESVITRQTSYTFSPLALDVGVEEVILTVADVNGLWIST